MLGRRSNACRSEAGFSRRRPLWPEVIGTAVDVEWRLPSTMVGYQSSQEHLLEELRRIDLMIRLQVLRLRLRGHAAMDDFRGLYIKEEEIDAILGQASPFDAGRGIDSTQLSPLLAQLAAMEGRVSHRTNTSQFTSTLR